jgi:transposase
VKDRLVLSDATWGRMAPLVIGRPDQKGSTGRDNRMFVEGVLWIVRTGSPWRDLPEAFDRRARRPSRPDLNYSANALPTLRTSS